MKSQNQKQPSDGQQPARTPSRSISPDKKGPKTTDEETDLDFDQEEDETTVGAKKGTQNEGDDDQNLDDDVELEDEGVEEEGEAQNDEGL